jgi:hypothetical protein
MSWLLGEVNHEGVTANSNDPAPPPGTVGEPDWNPGDPDGLVFDFPEVEPRSFASFSPSPHSGWPAEWSTQWTQFGPQFGQLVDTAWACLDLNSRILSAMPPYRVRDGQVLPPPQWMMNPDPTIYQNWNEFAKQLFWDYQLGECFILPMARAADGFPHSFRVIPPWLVNVEMDGGTRSYKIGQMDVTKDILHIRYKSTTDSARGVGPLESSGARMTAAAVLTTYVGELVKGGGVPYLTLETEFKLTKDEADDMREQWWAARMGNLGKPAVLHTGVKAVPHQMSPKDMAMLEIAQFTEARIAVKLGVPPFLVGLSGGDTDTYANATSLFDFHDRSFLKAVAADVMSALSGWSLPRGQAAELNRDEYTRPGLKDRTEANAKLFEAGVLTVEQWQKMERLTGTESAEALTGGGRS